MGRILAIFFSKSGFRRFHLNLAQLAEAEAEAEALLISTHNIRFHGEIKAFFVDTPCYLEICISRCQVSAMRIVIRHIHVSCVV